MKLRWQENYIIHDVAFRNSLNAQKRTPSEQLEGVHFDELLFLFD